MREFCGIVRLSLASNKSRTVGLATVTRLRVCAIAINVIVEDQLLACLDLALSKDAHAQLVSNHPLVHKTVGVAGMVAEPPEVALLCCVHEFALGQGHEVKVFYALLVVLYHAATKCSLIDNLAYVLEDEVSWQEVLVRPQAETLLVCFDYGNIGVLLAQEPLVLTLSAATAVTHTFHFGSPVDAVGVLATGIVAFRNRV